MQNNVLKARLIVVLGLVAAVILIFPLVRGYGQSISFGDPQKVQAHATLLDAQARSNESLVGVLQVLPDAVIATSDAAFQIALATGIVLVGLAILILVGTVAYSYYLKARAAYGAWSYRQSPSMLGPGYPGIVNSSYRLNSGSVGANLDDQKPAESRPSKPANKRGAGLPKRPTKPGGRGTELPGFLKSRGRNP